jgi:uncharacterized protein
MSPDRIRDLHVTERTRLRRKAERGHFDWPRVSAILDEGLVCHFACAPDGQPVVIPMAYGRIGRNLYVHGAVGNHALRSAASGLDVCVTVTLLDALVLSRSAFHHSMNYRSVVVFGRAERVTDPDEQLQALLAVVDHVVPGRSADTRPPSAAELRTTTVLRLPITEASAKVRTGPPVEEPDDLALPHWGGEIPIRVVAGTPVADDQGVAVPVPEHAVSYQRAG